MTGIFSDDSMRAPGTQQNNAISQKAVNIAENDKNRFLNLIFLFSHPYSNLLFLNAYWLLTARIIAFVSSV